MRRLLLALCVLMPTTCFADEWTPPDNPDPSAIMWEAKTDAAAGRYELALTKQLWYHHNALKINPAQSGVRLSFALSNWLELGEAYPPALSKMRETRDEVDARIRDKDQVRVKFADFHEFVAFNRTLRDEQRTLDTFKWIDENSNDDAASCFRVAQPALIKLKQYELCGKYVNPHKDVSRLRRSYEADLKLAKDRFGDSHREFAEKKLLNASTTLVALLVQTDREDEAKAAAKATMAFVEDDALQKKLYKQMEEALKGTVPKPWP